ncbi:MAG: hypothetical protein H0X63_13150 [Flavobacteriales bacterium]|nr:hypothetical protein [Flavobacteriales bacterium]
MKNNFKCELIPTSSVGPFKLGTKISKYEKFDLDYFPPDESTGWATYKMRDPELEIYTEEEIIISIACREVCNYKGQNLIGLPFKELMRLINERPEDKDEIIMEDGELQIVYEFYNFGLEVWTKCNIIVTVFCSRMIED